MKRISQLYESATLISKPVILLMESKFIGNDTDFINNKYAEFVLPFFRKLTSVSKEAYEKSSIYLSDNQLKSLVDYNKIIAECGMVEDEKKEPFFQQYAETGKFGSYSAMNELVLEMLGAGEYASMTIEVFQNEKSSAENILLEFNAAIETLKTSVGTTQLECRTAQIQMPC